MQDTPCRHLRTKKLYIPELNADALKGKESAGASEHCWCNKTMTEVGFDDRRVSPISCSRQDRACYQLP